MPHTISLGRRLLQNGVAGLITLGVAIFLSHDLLGYATTWVARYWYISLMICIVITFLMLEGFATMIEWIRKRQGKTEGAKSPWPSRLETGFCIILSLRFLLLFLEDRSTFVSVVGIIATLVATPLVYLCMMKNVKTLLQPKAALG